MSRRPSGCAELVFFAEATTESQQDVGHAQLSVVICPLWSSDSPAGARGM